MQHAVHALGRLDQLRQTHNVALDHSQPRIALEVLKIVGRALIKAVKHRHLRGALIQQHLGRCGAHQARTADNEKAVRLDRKGGGRCAHEDHRGKAEFGTPRQ
jgi:hypothetical protein